VRGWAVTSSNHRPLRECTAYSRAPHGHAAAVSDPDLSGAPVAARRAGADRPAAARVPPVARRRYGRAPLVSWQLSGRLHLLQLGASHARAIAHVRRALAAARPPRAALCAGAAI